MTEEGKDFDERRNGMDSCIERREVLKEEGGVGVQVINFGYMH